MIVCLFLMACSSASHVRSPDTASDVQGIYHKGSQIVSMSPHGEIRVGDKLVGRLTPDDVLLNTQGVVKGRLGAYGRVQNVADLRFIEISENGTVTKDQQEVIWISENGAIQAEGINNNQEGIVFKGDKQKLMFATMALEEIREPIMYAVVFGKTKNEMRSDLLEMRSDLLRGVRAE